MIFNKKENVLLNHKLKYIKSMLKSKHRARKVKDLSHLLVIHLVKRELTLTVSLNVVKTYQRKEDLLRKKTR